MPFTKYFCRKGYTQSMGSVEATTVAYLRPLNIYVLLAPVM